MAIFGRGRGGRYEKVEAYYDGGFSIDLYARDGGRSVHFHSRRGYDTFFSTGALRTLLQRSELSLRDETGAIGGLALLAVQEKGYGRGWLAKQGPVLEIDYGGGERCSMLFDRRRGVEAMQVASSTAAFAILKADGRVLSAPHLEPGVAEALLDTYRDVFSEELRRLDIKRHEHTQADVRRRYRERA